MTRSFDCIAQSLTESKQQTDWIQAENFEFRWDIQLNWNNMGFELPDNSTWLDWYDNWLESDFLDSYYVQWSPWEMGLWSLDMSLFDEIAGSRLSQ